MTKKPDDVVITAALRTPIGTYKGSLKDISADKLGAPSLSALISFKDPLYVPIGVLSAAVITTSSGFLVIANTP